MQKILIILKNASNESCAELNFLRKTSASISLSTPGMELVSKDLPFLKYYNALEWGSKFTIGLNTAKNIDYIEKCFKRKLRRIKFPTKNKLKYFKNYASMDK